MELRSGEVIGQSQSAGTTIEDRIIQDHREVKQFYQDYKRTGDVQFYNQLVWELCRHSIGEEICVYPVLDEFGDNTKKLRDEHMEANQLLKQMEGMTAGTAEFDQLFAKLMQALEEHMQEEESRDLPFLKQKMSVQDRINLGDKFQNRKKIAPTRPHTATPSNPTLEEALGLLLAPIDKFRDLFREFPEQQKHENITGAAHSSIPAQAGRVSPPVGGTRV